MAYPTVVSVKESGASSGTSDFTASDALSRLPTSRTAGNLLVAINYNWSTTSEYATPSGWTAVTGGSVATAGWRGQVWAKIATGDTGDNLVIVRSGGVSGIVGLTIYNIADWYGTISNGVEALVQSKTVATLDGDSLAPAWSSSEDHLWIGLAMNNVTITAAPSGYSTMTRANSAGSWTTFWTAYKTSTAASEDPGAWTISGTNVQGIVGTIAIRPTAGASAVAGISRHYARMMTG